MKVSQPVLAPPRRKLPAPPAELPKHDPSLLRNIVEKSAGVIGAVSRIPTSIVAGLTVGGYQGGRKGADPSYEIQPESVAIGVVTTTLITEVAQAAVSGYMMGGLSGSLAQGLYKGATESVGTYLFIKGGSAGKMAQEMTEAISAKVQPGAGSFSGVYRGAIAGTGSAVTTGAQTGYQEGRAAASGVLEGLKEVPKEFSQGRRLKGSFIRQAFSTACGVASALISAPAGLALALLKGPKASLTPSPGIRKLLSVASGAVIGGLAGLTLGPVGIVAGAALGAGLGLAGPGASRGFDAKLKSSLDRARADNTNLGSDIANNRRDLVERGITGTLSGARQGWDSGVALFAPKPSHP